MIRVLSFDRFLMGGAVWVDFAGCDGLTDSVFLRIVERSVENSSFAQGMCGTFMLINHS